MKRLLTFAIILMVACSRKVERTEGPPDGYKSPYIEVVDIAPVSPEPIEPPKQRIHPAALERPYPLISYEELATNEAEKEILGLLSDPKQGANALKAIKKLGTKGLEFARRALRCSNREVRAQAALVLANLEDGSRVTVQALCDSVLLDPDPDVRAIAAKAFVKIEKHEAVPTLIRSLKEDPFEPARANAAWALGNIGSSAAVQPLREALNDPDTWVRLRAVSALKKMKAKVAVPDLIERLSDSNSMVRERAREALKDLTGVDRGPDPAAWRR